MRLGRSARRRRRSRPVLEGEELAGLSPVVDALWPGAELHSGSGRSGPDVIDFLALPRVASPSLLLPVRPNRAAAAVLRAHRSPQSTAQRVRHATLVALARMGA